jgi:hypothetical protein
LSAKLLMTQNGFREDQVAQVRRLADQRLRKRDAPLDPLNRRISLIVQYRGNRREHRPRNPRRGMGNKNEASPPRLRRNRAEPGAPSGRKTAIVSVFRMSLKTCACWPVWRRNFPEFV